MRPQANQGQQSGEQKKSVFDRLGRQLDTRRSANRGSPARYGEHPMHPGMHEPPPPPPPEFGGGGGGRYMRGEGPPDLDWRYERRQQQQHMQFGRPERHPSQMGPQAMPPPHYDMDVMGPGRPPYYPHVPPQFAPGPPGSMPPMMGGPDPMVMGMHQQRRPSPKYDRHGNPIRGSIRIDHPAGMSPPGNYMGPPMPGPMMPPGAPYEMMPNMRPGMYPHERWDDTMEMLPPMPGPRLLPNDRFMDQRFQPQQQQQPQRSQKGGPMLMNPEVMGGPPQPNFEAPRYSKWRERRDVITNLDKQTAQSSSKTDSLKSSLQQPEHRSRRSRRNRARQEAAANKQAEANTEKAKTKVSVKKEPPKRKDPQDISDGEIIDDEDSSDDSDSPKEVSPTKVQTDGSPAQMIQHNRAQSAYARKPYPGSYHEASKRRRMHDRDEYSMDYETISDGELDDFMSDKKLSEDKEGEGQDGKSLSEIELLNALGLDWANLIELSKQSRKETPTTDSALRRFSIPKFLPTLGISKELAGPEIYDLIMKITS